MAESERVVMTHTVNEMAIMESDWKMPACATTHAKRRNNMTPQIFSRHGINTPTIHPNLIVWWCPDDCSSTSFAVSYKNSTKFVNCLVCFHFVLYNFSVLFECKMYTNGTRQIIRDYRDFWTILVCCFDCCCGGCCWLYWKVIYKVQRF